MSFTASTCLTYTGTTPLSGFMNIYSSSDFNTPLYSNVPLSAMTAPNCPYNFVVPDGTTLIRLVDPGTLCYIDMPISSNDLCATCNLGLNFVTGGTASISAGILTGSCQSTMTDYVINWYGPTSNSNIQFSSGQGSAFSSQYSAIHPFTGGTSNSPVIVPGGFYVPIITKVIVSGLTFSLTGGTNAIPANMDCLTGVTVSVIDYSCSNGTITPTSGTPYSHFISYNAAAPASGTSVSTAAIFQLSPTTNYFPWKFAGFGVYDTIKITFYGTAYSTPLILEYCSIGDNVVSPGNTLPSVMPKTVCTSIYQANDYFPKVTCLTGLTRNPGDYLKVEVIPNPNLGQSTSWNLYFACLDTFNCTKCLDNYKDTPYKIIRSSISASTDSCQRLTVRFAVSGCTTNQNNSSDFVKYYTPRYMESVNCDNTTGLLNVVAPLLYTQRYQIINSATSPPPSNPITCRGVSTATITTKKYVSGGTSPVGIIDFTFSDPVDCQAFFSSYNYVMSWTPTSVGGGIASGTPYNSYDMNYYRRFVLRISKATGSTLCGDAAGYIDYYLHPSMVVTTGTSGSDYTMRIVMSTIVNNINTAFTNCDINVYLIQGMVDNINGSSTATTNNFSGTSNTGARLVFPIYYYQPLTTAYTANLQTTVSGTYSIYDYSNKTYVYSSTTPSSIINSLSAKTCNGVSPNILGAINFASTFVYQPRMFNTGNTNDYQIWASPITNYTYSGYTTQIAQCELAYTFSAGTEQYYNPNYII